MARYTLITGASSGIGRAFADIAAERRRNLILTARRVDALEAVAEDIRVKHNVLVETIPADLSSPSGPDTLWSAAIAGGRKIDFLVNNAGLGANGMFAETDWAVEQRSIDVNITALTRLAKLAAPSMVEGGDGHILNVASVAAFLPGPGMAVYNASKAYVLSFSVALNNELEGTGVTVTALCPGATETEFFAAAEMQDAPIMKSKMPSAAEVARYGYFAAMDRQNVAVFGASNRGLAALTRFMPLSFAARATRRVVSGR